MRAHVKLILPIVTVILILLIGVFVISGSGGFSKSSKQLTQAQETLDNDQQKARDAQLAVAENQNLKLIESLGVNDEFSIDFVLIPSGSIELIDKNVSGNKKSNRTVVIDNPFYIGQTEVTQGFYEAVMGENPSRFKGENYPVENVSWNDAMGFCEKLSIKTGKTVMLPREKQWEYACRAGAKTLFSFGNSPSELHKFGNYCDQSNTDGLSHQDIRYNDGYSHIAPVMSFKPNIFGLYDMHGNAWEWCSDTYRHEFTEDGELVVAKEKANEQNQGSLNGVLRGGSWWGNDKSCYCSSRIENAISQGENIMGFGFRVVLLIN